MDIETIIKITSAVFSIIIMLIGFLYIKDLKKFKKYGYLGIFIISFLGSIAVFSPAAPMAAIYAGTIYNPLLVSFVSALGAICGDAPGYGIGYGGQLIIPPSNVYDHIKYFMKINGTMTIFILATIPNPFFDIAGIAAGASNFPFWKFVIISFIGKWIKFTIFSLVGRSLKKQII
jgi:membrane protein YqaA with SNARE-associated domain